MRWSRQSLSILLIVVVLGTAAGLMASHTLLAPVFAWFAPKEDGAWAAVSLDGRPVSPDDYRISISDRKVAGGRDGCNDWGFTDDPPGPSGDRAIISTLQACPEGNPSDTAYGALAFGQPRMEVRPDGTLRVQGRGHEGIFRRCHWKRIRESAPGSYSDMMKCVVD